MTDKKDFEISTDELENVNGGCGSGGPDECLPSDHGQHIGMYATDHYINKVLYFVKDNIHEEFFIGKLTRSWEHDYSPTRTRRVYDIDVKWRSKSDMIVTCLYDGSYISEFVVPGETLHRASADSLTIYEYNGTQYS